jgi:hypothetical protein
VYEIVALQQAYNEMFKWRYRHLYTNETHTNYKRKAAHIIVDMCCYAAGAPFAVAGLALGATVIGLPIGLPLLALSGAPLAAVKIHRTRQVAKRAEWLLASQHLEGEFDDRGATLPGMLTDEEEDYIE